jgi:hypothetical protein
MSTQTNPFLCLHLVFFIALLFVFCTFLSSCVAVDVDVVVAVAALLLHH